MRLIFLTDVVATPQVVPTNNPAVRSPSTKCSAQMPARNRSACRGNRRTLRLRHSATTGDRTRARGAAERTPRPIGWPALADPGGAPVANRHMGSWHGMATHIPSKEFSFWIRWATEIVIVVARLTPDSSASVVIPIVAFSSVVRSMSRYEADECSATNEWRAVAPQAEGRRMIGNLSCSSRSRVQMSANRREKLNFDRNP